MKNNDLDYLTLILTKNGTESFPIPIDDGEEKGFIAGIPKVIYDISQIIKKQFKGTKYKFSKYENDEIFIQERSKDFIIQIRGYFFLFPDYKEKLTKIIDVFKSNAYTFHLTRVDWAFTLDTPYQDFAEKLNKSKIDDTITKAIYVRKNAIQYLSLFHSRIKVVVYNKRKLNKQRRTKEDYRQLFKMKYLDAETRFEIRLLGKDTLQDLSSIIEEDLVNFLEFYKVAIGQYFSKRIKLTGGIKKLIPPDCKKLLTSNGVCNQSGDQFSSKSSPQLFDDN